MVSGDEQSVYLGARAPADLVVAVADAAGRPVRGAEVEFAVIEGGGRLGNATAVTDRNGEARTELVLGEVAGPLVVAATAALAELERLGVRQSLSAFYEAFRASGFAIRDAVGESISEGQFAESVRGALSIALHHPQEPVSFLPLLVLSRGELVEGTEEAGAETELSPVQSCLLLLALADVATPATEPGAGPGAGEGFFSATETFPIGLTLPVGTHSIRLHAIDSDRLRGSDTVRVTVEPASSVGDSTGATRVVVLPNGATMEFVWIAPGPFTMGQREQMPETTHTVTLTRGFWLGKYEITQHQWQSETGTIPWQGKNHVQVDPARPAVHISWEDVQDLVRRLNAQAGADAYRLPTEAEWEYTTCTAM